ncbi:MAG TPA: HK97-gp10 family putative phage morphogenesis protein [Candidatus Acidoferrales bacterium]
MARVVEVKITGLDQIEEMLERAPLRAAKAIMRNALRAAGRIWQQEIAARVRRGPHHGDKAHQVEFGILANHVSLSTHINGELEGSVSVGFSSKLYWAKFLEFGTGPRIRRPKGTSRKAATSGNRMPAFPFIRQSGEAKKQEVLDKFIERTREALEKEMKGRG